MTFVNPWGLLALLAVPAIIVIHLYQRRFPTLVVSGLHLWSVETRQSLPGRRREKLPVSTSLILECLAALLLALLLAGPRIGEANRVPHLVVVLDDSASMSARRVDGGVETTARDAAIRELSRRVELAGRGSVLSIVTSGVRPALLVGPAASWDDAQRALAAWEPRSPRHAFEPAWDLALQLADEKSSVLFLTDAVPQNLPEVNRTKEKAENKTAAAKTPEKKEEPLRGSLPERLELVSVGERASNLAIEASRWTFDPTGAKGELFVRVRNFSDQPQSAELVGLRNAETVFRKPIAIAAGGAESVLFDVPGGLGEVTVSIGTGTQSKPAATPAGAPPVGSAVVASDARVDALEIDSRVDLIEPKVRMVTVALTLPEGMGAARIKRVLEVMPGVQFGEADAAHLVIGPAGERPVESDRAWWLGIGPVSVGAAEREAAVDVAGPYLLEKSHPLLDGVVLGGVVWGGVQKGIENATPLISAGELPLLSRITGTRTVGYLLNIDLGRSNLTESPDWPILLTNLIELRRSELPGLSRWNYRLGEIVRFRLYEGAVDPVADGSGELTLVHNGVTRKVPRGPTVELTGTNETGLYVINEGPRELGRFAMQFNDLEESNLRERLPGRIESQVALAGRLEVESPFSWWLLAGIVAVMALLLGDYRSLAPMRGIVESPSPHGR